MPETIEVVLQFAPRLAAKTKEDIAAIEPEAIPSNFMLEFFIFIIFFYFCLFSPVVGRLVNIGVK